MRWLALLALALACKKDPAQAPVPTRGSGGSAVVPGDAATGDAVAQPLIELLHNVASEIEVSSRVANKKILPRHLVDGDLNTAWNSQTGELAGAWIYVGVPGAHIVELRMTAGHTGKGPKGEDYFTMNPRIKTITVLHDNDVVTTTTLDINRRDLQVIKLPTIVDYVRIRVDELAPGSKTTWRETCVSELEAWGTLRPGTTAKPTTPQVEVGEPIEEPSGHAPITDPDAYCAELMKPAVEAHKSAVASLNLAVAECLKQHPEGAEQNMCMTGGDGPGDPACQMYADTPIKVGPWLAAGAISVSNDSIYGANDIQPVVQTTKGWFVVGSSEDCGHFSLLGPCGWSIASAKVHGDVLDLRWRISRGDTWQDYAITCTMADTVTCTDPSDAGSGAGSGTP